MTVLPRDVNGIRYAICIDADVPAMRRMLAATFAANDPMAVAAGLTAPELEDFLAVIATGAGRSGLAIIARDLASEVLVGAAFAEDATSAASPPDHVSPKFTPVFDILTQLDAKLATPPPVPGETMHVVWLGVANGFARRGIGRELVRVAVDNAVARGYRRAVTEASNLVSQRIFHSLGFTIEAHVSYADYRHDGAATFASITDHGGPMAMVRVLY